MSKNAAQKRAEKRNANTRRRQIANKNKKTLHKKDAPVMHWEEAKGLFDNLVGLVNQSEVITMYLQDKLIAKHVNADPMIETLAGLHYDVKTYVEPPMMELRGVLEPQHGLVKDEDAPLFIKTFQALNNMTDLITGGPDVLAQTAWTRLTRAVNKVKEELGVDEYIPEAVKAYHANLQQQQALANAKAPAHVH